MIFTLCYTDCSVMYAALLHCEKTDCFSYYLHQLQTKETWMRASPVWPCHPYCTIDTLSRQTQPCYICSQCPNPSVVASVVQITGPDCSVTIWGPLPPLCWASQRQRKGHLELPLGLSAPGMWQDWWPPAPVPVAAGCQHSLYEGEEIDNQEPKTVFYHEQLFCFYYPIYQSRYSRNVCILSMTLH